MPDAPETVLQRLGLTNSVDYAARTAFTKLCTKGCDARRLGELLAQWKDLRGTLEINGREIHLNPMDDWDAALKGVKLKDLANLDSRIQRQEEDLRELQATIVSLQHTRLVKRLSASGIGHEVNQIAIAVRQGTGVLLEAFELYRTVVLLSVLEASHQIGPKRSPDRTRRQRKLCEYVHDATQNYYYEDIALIFQALDPNANVTAQSLKQREHRTKKVTEKSPK